MDLGLEGAGVLVTGGSGGIGSAVARQLSAEGARVAVHDHRNAAAAEALAAGLGRLDACVANAGVWPAEDVPVSQLPLERWRATFGEGGHADYAAAKAAIGHGLLLSLKNEVVKYAPRARVNLVAPGWTVSPMTASDLTPELVGRVTATMALRKLGETTDIAEAITFLCSPRAAGHITGQVITAAGGMDGRLLHVPPEEGLTG